MNYSDATVGSGFGYHGDPPKRTRFGTFRHKVWMIARTRRSEKNNPGFSRQIAEELKVSETRVSEALVWLEANNYLR